LNRHLSIYLPGGQAEARAVACSHHGFPLVSPRWKSDLFARRRAAAETRQ
jgi:hypothetical protein